MVFHTDFERSLGAALAQRAKQQRYRQRQTLGSAQGVRISIDDRTLTNFCSNDYLGLANHPELIRAAQEAVTHYGVGGGASHLVCGHNEHHHLLEKELAAFTKRDRVLLFANGYMANMGVMQALLGRRDSVFQDKLNHASLLDGAILSRAKLLRYAHNDIDALECLLQNNHQFEKRLLVSDGVFSMDGDFARLDDLARLSESYDVPLMVDDAHGFGCIGEDGGGLQSVYQLDQARLPILIGTLGKAFGSYGAFVAGSEALIETLIQFARTYIYTTSIPPSIAAASRCSLRLIQMEGWRRTHLVKLIHYFQRQCTERGWPVLPSKSPIQPLLIGDDKKANALSEALLSRGFLVSAIRPPTVPEGTARLRVTLSAAHAIEDVDALIGALHASWSELGR